MHRLWMRCKRLVQLSLRFVAGVQSGQGGCRVTTWCMPADGNCCPAAIWAAAFGPECSVQRATRQSNTAADTDIVPGTALGAVYIRAEVASVYMRACGAIEAMSDSTVDLAIGRLQIIFNNRRLLGIHALAILFPFLAKSEGRRPLLRAMLTYRALEVSRHGEWLVEDDVSLFATANNLDVCLTHAVEVAPPDHLADNSVAWVSPESRFLNRTFLLPDGTDNVLAEPATWDAHINSYLSPPVTIFPGLSLLGHGQHALRAGGHATKLVRGSGSLRCRLCRFACCNPGPDDRIAPPTAASSSLCSS